MSGIETAILAILVAVGVTAVVTQVIYLVCFFIIWRCSVQEERRNGNR